MPIDIFTRERFEAALPNHKVSGNHLWHFHGSIAGEYCYYVHTVIPEIVIYVRSSVDPVTGKAAASGEDSIRIFLWHARKEINWGGKAQAYVTRVPGWEGRLKDQLRKLWKAVEVASRNKCSAALPASRTRDDSGGPCDEYPKFFKARNGQGANKGRTFLACSCGRVFRWLEPGKEEKGEKGEKKGTGGTGTKSEI